MVADNNEQPVSDKETLSTAQVGNGGQPPGSGRRLVKPGISKKRQLLLCALLALVILAGGWYVAKNVFHIGDKVYATAVGHKIYKNEIDDLVGTTKGVSNKDAATVLANKYLYQAMAKKAGITVTDQDVTAQYPSINDKKVTNTYVRQSDVNTVYYNKLVAYNTGLYRGKLLVANFSRNIAFESPYIGIQKATNPSLGNPAAVAADKKYAHDFITKLYDQVKAGKITFDQAIQKEHDDPVVGEQAYQALAHSGPFNTSNLYLGATKLVSPQSIQPKLASMKAGQLSAPFPVSVANSWTDKKITTESYYLVVRMDSTQGSRSGLAFDQYLAKAKKQYGYKVYN